MNLKCNEILKLNSMRKFYLVANKFISNYVESFGWINGINISKNNSQFSRHNFPTAQS